MKSPCLSCPHGDKDKRDNQACLECKDRVEYINMIQKGHGMNIDDKPKNKKTCRVCGETLPVDNFRFKKRGDGRVSICRRCDAETEPETNQLAGFEIYRYQRPSEEFVSVTAKSIRLTKSVVDRLGKPERVGLYFNPKTKQIAINPGQETPSKMTMKNTGGGEVSCKGLIASNAIKVQTRIKITWVGNVAVTEGLECSK